MIFGSEENAFLAAIRHEPENDCLMLAFARWLDTRGNPVGEFIRLQCACDCADCREGVDQALPNCSTPR